MNRKTIITLTASSVLIINLFGCGNKSDITESVNVESVTEVYSIIETGTISSTMPEWAAAYYDYLVDGNLERDFYNETVKENYSLCLCCIDEDDVPELYVYTDIYAGANYALYTYYNGKVVQLFESCGSNHIEWIERSGRVLYRQELSAMYAESVWIYEMANGELQQIAEGTLITQDYTDWYEGNLPPSTWNGQDVTEDEYQERLNEVFGTRELSYDENNLLDFYSLLDMLTSL